MEIIQAANKDYWQNFEIFRFTSVLAPRVFWVDLCLFLKQTTFSTFNKLLFQGQMNSRIIA